MSERQAYIEKLEATLKEWDSQISKLSAKVKKVKADIKIDYNNKLDHTKAKREELASKIQDLQLSGDDAWQAIKDGADLISSDIKKTFDNIKSKFE